MERRAFIKSGAVIGISTAFAHHSKADDLDNINGEKLEVTSEISSNHSHAISLSSDELLLLLRKTKRESSVKLNIQGTSTHEHEISLNYYAILEILTEGKFTFESSDTFGHKHSVTINLAEKTIS